MLYVVTGSPLSGKSTYVDEHRSTSAIVVDLDRIAHALGYPDAQIDWDVQQNHPAVKAALGIRRRLIATALETKPTWETWIIDSQPSARDRAKYVRARAVIVDLDPGLQECLRRAQASGRTNATREVHAWHTRQV